MPTISGENVEIRYALVDLTAPQEQLDALRADLRFLHRKRRQGAIDVDISVNIKRDNTRAIVKIAVAPDDFPALQNYFQNAPWRDAVLAVRNVDAHNQVLAIVNALDWRAELE